MQKVIKNVTIIRKEFKLKYTEFKNDVENGKVHPAYLFLGEDSFFSVQGLNLLTDRFIDEKSLNFTQLNAEDVSVGEIISSLDALPFLSQKRMVVLREYYPKADEIKLLVGYFENPNESSILVILNTKQSEGLKKIKDICLVECAKMDANTISRWIKGECASNDVAIDLETSRLIAEYCLCDMNRVKIEVFKLCSYAYESKQINKSDVELLISKDSDYKVYQMTDYIAKKQFDNALSVINEMLSRGEPHQRIMTSVYYYFRKLLHLAISDKTDAELARIFNGNEYGIKKARQQAKMFKIRALKSSVDYLCDADFKFKSGKSSVEDEMWLSVFKIMVS